MRSRVRSGGLLLALTLVSLTVGQAVAQAGFAPQLGFSATSTIFDSPSGLVIRSNQNDGELSPRRFSVTLPSSWRFGVGSIRPSSITCSQIQGGAQGLPIDEMESLGQAVVRLHVDETRGEQPGDEAEAFVQQQARDLGLQAKPTPAVYSGDGTTGQTAALWFQSWDSATSTATLCGRLRTTRQELIAGGQEIVVFELKLRRTDDGSECPTSEPGGCWLLSFTFDRVPGADPLSPRSLTDNPFFTDRSLTILEVWLSISAVSGGNYNLDADGNRCWQEGVPSTDQKLGACSALFSRTPTQTGDHVVRTRASACPTTACSVPEVVVDLPFVITRPASQFIHKAGVLLGPARQGIPFGFGLVRGTNAVTITWEQPPLTNFERVKGYVIAIARPGEQESRHFQYVVTDPNLPDFDPRLPCGSDGREVECSLTLHFPLSTIGSTPLRTDGLYDMALVTLYPDGHRTDGLCDPGPDEPAGVPCPASVPPAEILSPGVSTWQFLLRSNAWPLAYVEPQVFVRSGGGGSYTAPAYVLLIDFSLRRAEFVVWRANPDNCFQASTPSVTIPTTQTTIGSQSQSRCFSEFRSLKPGFSYAAASNQILGDNSVGGAVSFASSTMYGSSVNFRFDGWALEDVSAVGNLRPQAPCGNKLAQACGIFLLWDTKGLPGSIPPGGQPQTFVEPFEGFRVR